MIKKFIFIIFAYLISFSLFAAPLQKLGEGEGTLNVVAWAGYLERGATMEAFDWVTGYEDNTGCKVNIKTAGILMNPILRLRILYIISQVFLRIFLNRIFRLP